MNIKKYLYVPGLEKKSYLGRIWGYAWRGCAVSFVLSPLSAVPLIVIGLFTHQDPPIIELESPPLNAANVYFSVVIMPLIEECISRGPLRLSLYWKRRPKWFLGALLAITSVIFGMVHPLWKAQNPWSYMALYYGFVMTAKGLVSGWVCIASRSLVAAIIQHSLSNALSVVFRLVGIAAGYAS